ncbi:hypothetical protein pVco7_gp098 [Vibrio phage pVco-7]|uniref:Nucleotide modification associated domain-containing protein n=1 Tax=Vibrio phage pVco-5 TaxID=1965485 RepID=A0A1W6JV12_9CAUD|nr:hypothetical protein KNT61_gp098 [Vibrio phage pVco-5]ARM71086.1 hypothetical protein pVco5_098 [Vibrio phage pVco-5]
MKSIRLNTEIREAIIKNISDAYDKNNPKPELTIDTGDILEKAVRQHYMKQSLEMRKLIEANPILKDQVSTTGYIQYISPTGSWGSVYLYDKNNSEAEKVRALSKYSGTRDFSNPDYLAKHPSLKKAAEEFTSLQKAARKEREALSDWNKARTSYLDEIQQVLKGVNTTKQLMEQWEEVKEFIPQAYFNPSKIALPAINTKALNEKLGK